MSTSSRWVAATPRVFPSSLEASVASLEPETLHRVGAVVVSALALLAAPLAHALPTHAQLGILAAVVGVLGLPHGALDWLEARVALRPRYGPSWTVLFLGAYLSVIGAVLVAWFWFPSASLFAFLLASAVHFGTEDALFLPTKGLARLLDATVRGALPILVPLALYSETTQFLSWLLPAESALDPALLEGGAQLALVGVAVVLGASFFRGTRRPELVRVATLALLFAALPPLISFPVYFSLWHAPSHVIGVGRRLEMAPSKLLRSLFEVALPLTVVTLVGALGAWLYLRETGLDFAPATARVVFIGLSALTAPHMLASAIFERKP